MEVKILLHRKTITLVWALVILFFTCQSFGADSKGAKTSQKPQSQKQTAKKAVIVRKINPDVNPSSFRRDMPFREAIDILRNSTIPPLNIAVMWKDLDEHADITPDTPIGIDGVSGVPLKMHLTLLLLSLSSTAEAPIGYVVEDNVIIIGTKALVSKKMVTRFYYIADVAALPSMAGMMPMMGMGMMPYGNMMPYGVGGIPGGYQQYGNPAYPNQGYNSTQPNQNQQQSYNNNQARPFGMSR
jgi:hypothetical protein